MKAIFKNINLDSLWINREETKDDLVKLIRELEKARNVREIQLDDRIMDIIKEEYPDLYKRIYPDK